MSQGASKLPPPSTAVVLVDEPNSQGPPSAQSIFGTARTDGMMDQQVGHPPAVDHEQPLPVRTIEQQHRVLYPWAACCRWQRRHIVSRHRGDGFGHCPSGWARACGPATAAVGEEPVIAALHTATITIEDATTAVSRSHHELTCVRALPTTCVARNVGSVSVTCQRQLSRSLLKLPAPIVSSCLQSKVSCSTHLFLWDSCRTTVQDGEDISARRASRRCAGSNLAAVLDTNQSTRDAAV